jgi:N-acetylglucosamine kinase-like BadF-type ATPase
VQAVAYEWVLRGPPTMLTPAFMRVTGAPDLTALIEGLTTGRFEIDARHAPLIFQVALQGDAVARECIAWAGRELAQLALCVIRQLQLQQLEFDVVLIGSLHKGGALLTDPLRAALVPEAPRARLVPLSSPPATGGVLLAMRAAGLDAGAVRAQLLQNAAAFIEQP